MSSWKEKVNELKEKLREVNPVVEKMTGSITLNLHEGNPVDCVIEPVIRVK